MRVPTEDQVFEVAVQERVVDRRDLAAEDAQPGATQLVLVLGGEQAAAAFAKRRQFQVFCICRCPGNAQHQREETTREGGPDERCWSVKKRHVESLPVLNPAATALYGKRRWMGHMQRL